MTAGSRLARFRAERKHGSPNILPDEQPGQTAIGAPADAWHPHRVRWNEEKSRRFQALRVRETEGALGDAERAELEALLAALDADEAETLRPAMARMTEHADALRAENAKLDAEAAELVRIADEQEGLLAEARAYLHRLRDRSAALADDYRRATGREPAPAR